MILKRNYALKFKLSPSPPRIRIERALREGGGGRRRGRGRGTGTGTGTRTGTGGERGRKSDREREEERERERDEERWNVSARKRGGEIGTEGGTGRFCARKKDSDSISGHLGAVGEVADVTEAKDGLHDVARHVGAHRPGMARPHVVMDQIGPCPPRGATGGFTAN